MVSLVIALSLSSMSQAASRTKSLYALKSSFMSMSPAIYFNKHSRNSVRDYCFSELVDKVRIPATLEMMPENWERSRKAMCVAVITLSAARETPLFR